jgi:hypothetical protein
LPRQGRRPSAGPGIAFARFPLICARVARAPEDQMRNIDPPDPAVRAVLHDATVDLRNIALTVDRASAVLDPSLELIEASHAIHRALILLSEWCDPTESDQLIDA